MLWDYGNLYIKIDGCHYNKEYNILEWAARTHKLENIAAHLY